MTSKLSVSLSLHKILRENNNKIQKHLANFNFTKRHLSQLKIYIDQTRDGVNKELVNMEIKPILEDKERTLNSV